MHVFMVQFEINLSIYLSIYINVRGFVPGISASARIRLSNLYDPDMD